LIESLENLDEIRNELELKLANEEKDVIKYLIVSAEWVHGFKANVDNTYSYRCSKNWCTKKLDREDIIALIAGITNKRIRFPKKDEIDDFCRVYEELYEKTWNGKIPSKTELRYWIYAFAFEYAKTSDEKCKKIKEEKQKRR